MHRVERSYGSFRRDIFLPAEVEADHTEAVFDQGVLTVVLPEPPGSAQNGRKIPIKEEELDNERKRSLSF